MGCGKKCLSVISTVMRWCSDCVVVSMCLCLMVLCTSSAIPVCLSCFISYVTCLGNKFCKVVCVCALCLRRVSWIDMMYAC